MADDGKLEEALEEAIEDLEEAIEDTSKFSIEEALEFWQGIVSHGRSRIEACEADIRRAAERAR